MKNLTFGKMMGLFAGFIVLMIVVGLVVAKMSQKGVSQQVQSKVYHHNKPQQVADAASKAQAASQAPASAPQQAAFQPIAIDTPAAGPAGLSTTQAPQPAPIAPIQQMPVQTAPQMASVDVSQHLANIDTSVSGLDSRVSALESGRGVTSATGAGRKVATHHKAKNATRAPAALQTTASVKPAEDLSGYKTMAVVSHRAWIKAPDGTEDSVVQGDALPRAKVKSVNVDTGVVITTTDQRITPN
jgi:hypothetical protein